MNLVEDLNQLETLELLCVEGPLLYKICLLFQESVFGFSANVLSDSHR